MSQLLEKENIKIENLIYEIRGKQVMLDSDIANIFCVTTGNLNKSMKRNIDRFPEEFCFQITKDEYLNLIFQIGISKSGSGGRQKMPYVYTEQGVAMLSAVIHSEIAIEMSIKIMNAFVYMRRYISTDLIEQNNINSLVFDNRKRIEILENSFSKYSIAQENLFFEGQIYDAYSLMKDIINLSNKSIIIIDNYIDKSLLDILSKTNKEILIITNKYNNEDYEKYKKQYSNIEIKINNSFHDRFIIIDEKTLYHCGASFKDLGRKCFSITRIEDNEILNNLLNKIIL